METVIYRLWGVHNYIGSWSASIKQFLQLEVELVVLYQLFWLLTAAPILSPGLAGIPRYLLPLSLPLSLSLFSSLSLFLSLSVVWQLLLPCLSLPSAPYRSQRRRGDEGKWRPKKEPPVTSSPRSCMAARFNLLRYWLPKPKKKKATRRCSEAALLLGRE